jgi:hypothetical protein
LDGVQCFADLAAYGVRLGQVEVVAGLPFRRQTAGVDLLCQLDGLPGVAELDRDRDGVDGDVGGADLGAVSSRSSPSWAATLAAVSRCWLARPRWLSRAAATAVRDS